MGRAAPPMVHVERYIARWLFLSILTTFDPENAKGERLVTSQIRRQVRDAFGL